MLFDCRARIFHLLSLSQPMKTKLLLFVTAILATTCVAQEPLATTPGGSKPVPDPTTLTTQQLVREMANLKELMESKIADGATARLAQRSILETRLDAMDKAIKLIQDITDKLPARIDEKISSLKEIHDEKFQSVKGQFEERDVRAKQSSLDSKTAVDAALQAAKEAVAEQQRSSAASITKTELNTTKQIEQLGDLIRANNKAADDKISDIKDRLTRIEGRGEGASGKATESQANIGVWIGVAGVGMAVVMAVLTIITITRNRDIAIRKPV